ncbi:MAG TPA: valine--tRNA ligase [Candidatus Nitrosopolaris sp.]|nr:valine--tRNA ligase [Candidatus Nitrosopolaris sp.]
MKLAKAYEPNRYEADIYKLWEDSGVFKADPNSGKEHFSVSMPPPNETSTLHMGGALFLTLQDIMVRHARQLGKDVLWLPGTDHAAIATNAVVERQLAEQGTDKHQIGREAFIAKVKEFAGGNRETMISQMRAMGASCDWSRFRYTLDDSLNRSVNEVFNKMYQDGLIYRGHRIVNWDPKLETTVSDDEVDYVEEKAPLYTLQYGPFQISTARPETKFGDKYVVVHPEDKRYKNYSDGQTFECEWLNGKVTATIVKDEAVNPEFGTGVMTITPWHDRTDFEIAERHGLEREQIIDYKGKLLPIAGEFSGMDIEEARPKIVDKLKAKGLLVKVDEDYTHNIALNSRGKGVIEPQIMLQWFVDVNRPAVDWKGQMRSFKEVMRAVVEDGDIRIIPKRFEKIYYHWIDNLRDWCISRQIWWGHQVPVWYRQAQGDRAEGVGDSEETYVGTQAPEGQGWKQDPDTLDTWFSSALWTWSTLIDPKLAADHSLSLDQLLEKSVDYRTYHPTSVMETGWDILFFWVARMILATTYVTGQIPFRTVYLHGLVRTEEGKKMSKSDPDTIVDPLDMIAKYGTDALRLALVSGTGAGNDQRLGLAKIVANRNFCNKLWNIARYVEDAVGEDSREGAVPKSIADHWILNKLSIFSQQLGEDLTNFRFAEAYDKLYHFVWDDFADWYIEASKVELNAPLLAYVLEQTLKLTHPFAPFLTETIWRELGWQNSMLISQPWPEICEFEAQEAEDFQLILQLTIWSRAASTLADFVRPNLFFMESSLTLKDNANLLKRLARLKSVDETDTEKNSFISIEFPAQGIKVWLDIDVAKYRSALENQLKEVQGEESILRTRIENPEYKEKAPKELVEQTEKALADASQRAEQLQKILQNL